MSDAQREMNQRIGERAAEYRAEGSTDHAAGDYAIADELLRIELRMRALARAAHAMSVQPIDEHGNLQPTDRLKHVLTLRAIAEGSELP